MLRFSWPPLTACACACACACAAPSPSPPRFAPAAPSRGPIAFTYLGVAGWQIEAGGKVILADPYLSRPTAPDAPLVPDAAAIAAHTPPHADLILVGHSHYDHLLDAPTVALQTGAQLVGSLSTTRVARASGVPADHLITIKGGEDFEMDGYSLRVIPSLHAAIGDKHIFGDVIPADPHLPMPASGYQEGGTFAYLLRIAGHEILILDTANFIEREVTGLRPDIAVIAPGAREHIHDYTCRLLHALGDPPTVLATHFDDWKAAPVDVPPSDDLETFAAEVRRCSPHTKLVVPRHFQRGTVEPKATSMR